MEASKKFYKIISKEFLTLKFPSGKGVFQLHDSPKYQQESSLHYGDPKDSSEYKSSVWFENYPEFVNAVSNGSASARKSSENGPMASRSKRRIL